ncbi:hypothetical protein [Nocardioides sp. LML1-1-1.1]|uniref:hypothetical protein n=1 Tax=Nocardioides sp. LML1-1-1.1 TaxID=3135248 RepID=UPI003431544D
MSPWTEKTGPVWPLYAGFALLALAAGAGLLLLTGVVDSDDEPRPPKATTSATATPDRPSPSASAAPAPAPGDGLQVVSWGHARGQLALVVRNTSARTVEQARVRITATDARGAVLLSTTGGAGDVCCTVTGLAPGADVALFADPLPRPGDVRSVDVDAVSLDAGPATPAASVRAGRATLRRLPDDTVVSAGLVARGDLSGYVAAQAVLVDARGRVAQVVSGRFYCFEPGRPRTVRLHLFHAVPAGLRVQRVLAQPVPAGAPGVVPGRCG